MKWEIVSFLLFLFSLCEGVIYKLSDEEHQRMPKILRLDPYDRCMRDPQGVYCSAYVAFVSDEPSALLTQMQEYSAHITKHFNHTRGIYGACMTRECAAFYNSTIDPRVALEACLNKSMYEDFGLKVKVEDSDEEISCMGAGFERKPISTAHIVVAVVGAVLLLLNIVGSLVDACCQTHNPLARFLVCFSMGRNWQKLVAEAGGEDRFKGFYGIRAIMGTLVISAHSMLPIMLLNDDTKMVEDLYENLIIQLFLNGTLIMQGFLQLSALLLAYNGQHFAESHKSRISIWLVPQVLFKRWLRLTPTYALVLAITATWMQNMGSGPFWQKLVTIESVDCQRYWWMHLLYINNYFDESHCMPQAWYLAADTQLFCLGIAVHVLCKTPRSRKVVLSLLFVFGILAPGIHTYYQDLDGALIVSPDTAQKFFMSDPTFNNVYKRGHTNVSSYVIGMALGYLAYHLKKINFDVVKYQNWRFLYWASIPLGFVIVLSCKVFYADAPRISIYVRVATACLIRPAFGVICAIVIFGQISNLKNMGWGLLEWRGWTSLGRVSYCAYLLHVLFIRCTGGVQAQAVHGAYLRMSEMVLFDVAVSYMAAYVFWIMVESPLSEVVKCILGPAAPRAAPGPAPPSPKLEHHTQTKL